MAGGIAVRLWAIVVLGRFFTVDVRLHAHQRVDRGPYRWVRHPAYTGLIVFCVGFGLTLSNWASLAGLGEDYRRYAAGRRRLFPGVW